MPTAEKLMAPRPAEAPSDALTGQPDVARGGAIEGPQPGAAGDAAPGAVGTTPATYSLGDLERVEKHLSRLDPAEHNGLMIGRIQEALKNGQPLSDRQTNFMRHELLEDDLMSKGMPYDDAHAEALKLHPPGQNYDLDIIDQFESFGPWWRKMNGLGPR